MKWYCVTKTINGQANALNACVSEESPSARGNSNET